MTGTNQSPSNKRKLKFLIAALAGLLLLARMGYTQPEATNSGTAVLKGIVQLSPTRPLPDSEEKIQPGTPVKINVKVENKGDKPNLPGVVFVRYALSKPLHNEEGSVIFETEKKTLPKIEPGAEIDIAFDLSHPSPSLPDFVRDDWSLREYQAIVDIKGESKIIGTTALTFSAYYYPGMTKQLSVKFPADSTETDSAGSPNESGL